MKILRAEKFKPRKRSESTQTKSATTPRRTDWDVLMQHDRVSGKLNLKSKEFIKDPGSVKRLLEAEMIDPDGKLTPAARKKCAELGRKLQTPQTDGAGSQEEVRGARPQTADAANRRLRAPGAARCRNRAAH
jgi:hypothetical protein